MKKAICEAVLIIVLALAFISALWLILGAGPPRKSCCSDRDVLVQGMLAAHDALHRDEPDTARWVVEETLRAVDETLHE